MKTIKSSINLDKNTWLYSLELPWIKRYFEWIYYCFEWTTKLYWLHTNKFKKLDFWNKIIWITTFYDYYTICFINLENLSSKYFFAKAFDTLEFILEWKNYSALLCKDFQGKNIYFHNYKWKNFSIESSDKEFLVKNKILETIVFSKKISLENTIFKNKPNFNQELPENPNFLSIADFFVYDDYFVTSKKNNFSIFYSFLENINGKAFKVNSSLTIKLKIQKYSNPYYPKLKINLSVFVRKSHKNCQQRALALWKDQETLPLWNTDFDFEKFRKLILAFLPENTVCDLINNDSVRNYFSPYLNDLTNIKLDNINPNFDIPKNIFSGNTEFIKFKKDLLKLRYNLFLLKEAYALKYESEIEKPLSWILSPSHEKEEQDENVSLFEKRLGMVKENLEVVILKYEKILEEFLMKIV